MGQVRAAREAARFHLLVLLTLILAVGGVLTTINPITVTEYSVVFSAVALPLTYFPILVIANDPDYMGDKTNGRIIQPSREHLSRHHRHRLGRGDTADDLDEGGAVMADGRTLDLHLQLLDRQVIDPDGRLVCKVDDLELDVDETGRPFVTAILVGPRALGPRLGGRLGRWVSAIGRRLSDGQGEHPPRIDFALVSDIGSAITIVRRCDELGVTSLEHWVDAHVIARIPGSGHASE